MFELAAEVPDAFDGLDLTALQTLAAVLSGRLALAKQLRSLQAEIAERDRAVDRLAAQYKVTQILSDANAFMDVAAAILQVIGEQFCWETGLLWCVQGDTNQLACTATWSSLDQPPTQFFAASQALQLAAGVGLPGRVWATREPAWIPNILQDQNFPRLVMATQEGLQSAFAFAIVGQTDFFGVLEFFSRDLQSTDPRLLDTTAGLGRQLGSFIERRRAQQAQRESERYTGAILETALDAIIGIDHTGLITEWNQAAEYIFGYRRADVLGAELVAIVVPPSLHQAHRQGLARYLATGSSKIIGRRLELAAVRRDGVEFPVELAITRIPGEGPPRFIGYVRDITERKRAEEAIRFQARLLDIVEQAVIATDMQGAIKYWNHFAEQLYGWTEDQALGRDARELIPAPEAGAQAVQIMERLQVGEGWAGELLVRHRDGTRFPALITCSPIFDPLGQLVGTVGISQDISARKRAEHVQRFLVDASVALAASLDYQKTLEQVAGLAVPELGDWCVVDLLENGAIRQMVVAHLDPAKVELARSLRQRYPLDLDADYGVPRVLRTGQPELIPSISDELLRKVVQDDEHLALLRTLGLRSGMVVPLRARGRTLGAITLVAASLRRQYEPADLALAVDFAMRAAMAIDNAALYEEAQAAIQMRDEFLSIASHELKTPLTIVLGHTQVLQRRATRAQAFGERDQRALQVIVEQAVRLNKQISTLLDISRIELGKFRIELGVVDMVSLARRVVEELEPTLERHSIHFGTTEPSSVVWGDERLLEQVLQNLLGNAIKYSTDGGVITLQLWREADEVLVSVRDQGIGIPEAALPHLFQRFYRASNVDGQHISGLGIGLYLVHEIVTHHGGTIAVSSTLGSGSTFTLRLPLSAAEGDERSNEGSD